MNPGVVNPVASLGAPFPGLDLPLATKYGNEPTDPVQNAIQEVPAKLVEVKKLLTAVHLSYWSQLVEYCLCGRTENVAYKSPCIDPEKSWIITTFPLVYPKVGFWWMGSHIKEVNWSLYHT